MIALSKNDWKNADTYLGKAIHLKPKDVNSYINRALARYNLNNLRGTMSDYDTALDIDPNNFLAHYNRGLLRMQLGDDNRAITDFNYVIKMEPDNVMATFNRAILLDKTGNLHAAIRDYSKVISQFPNFWTGLSRRANCYRRLGMTGKAELDEFRILKAQMNKHLGVQPRWSNSTRKKIRRRSETDPEKYNQMVVEDNTSVEHEYKSEYRGKIQNRSVEMQFLPMYVLSLSPYNSDISQYQPYSQNVEQFNHAQKSRHTVYVNCYSQQLNEQQSQNYLAYIDTLTTAIESSSSKGMGNDLLNRSISYATVQDYESAQTDVTIFLTSDSTTSLAYWQRAICQWRINEFNTSQGVDTKLKNASIIGDLTTAINLDISNQYLYYDRANVYASSGNYKQAIADYTMAISLDPNLAEAYYNRGLAHMNIKDKIAGISDLSKAGELGLYDAYSLIKRIGKETK